MRSALLVGDLVDDSTTVSRVVDVAVIGCYADDWDRDLSIASVNSDYNTLEFCADYCFNAVSMSYTKCQHF